ncbi:hypothetical protein L484_017508 [Morus notabilis]|uniref:Uncharacterized protein n=1 Tax=Morus notabilis TaxID=981085 RepID=W9R440_9ROSA|nr:hypothetical protein L484_017508 [Morus notabilis]
MKISKRSVILSGSRPLCHRRTGNISHHIAPQNFHLKQQAPHTSSLPDPSTTTTTVSTSQRRRQDSSLKKKIKTRNPSRL